MLIEKARELGILLAQSPEFVRMRVARKAVDENEAVSAMLSEFTGKRERLMTSLSGEDNDAVEALALTNDLDRLKQQLSDNPVMTELIDSEQAFSELVGAINREISACVSTPGDSACGGNCSACGGCKH